MNQGQSHVGTLRCEDLNGTIMLTVTTYPCSTLPVLLLILFEECSLKIYTAQKHK